MLNLIHAVIIAATVVDASPPAEPVKTTGTAVETIEVPSLLIKIAEQVDVPAREAGVLSAVHIREGQVVTQGTLIAQVEDDEATIVTHRAKVEIALAQANAENDVGIRFAKKSLLVAKAELARSNEAIAAYDKSISASEMDRQRLLVDKALVEVEQAEHEFKVAAFGKQIKAIDCEAAEQAINRHKIVSPLSGMVVQVFRHRGEWIKPGETLARIVCLDHLRADGFLNSRYLTQDLEGHKARLTVDVPRSPAAEFPGKITFLDPEIDPVNGQFHIWIDVANVGMKLRPGMRAKMSLEVQR